MRNARRWMPAVMVAAGLVLAGGAVAQKQPDPPPAVGGKGAQAGPQGSRKQHLQPPPPIGQAPQPRPPQQAQPGTRPAQPGAGPQASQKLHLQPPPPIGQAQPRTPPAPPGTHPPQATQGPQPSQKLHLTPPRIAPDPRGPRPGTRPPNEREAQRQAPDASRPDWPALPPRMAQEPPALATLRGLLSDNVALGYREARQEGEVLTLLDADLRRENERVVIEELILDRPSSEGLRRGEARNIRLDQPDGPIRIAQVEIEGLAMLPLRPGQAPSDRDPDQVTLEALRVAGLAVTSSDARVNLTRFELANWRLGQSGRLAMEGLEVQLDGLPVDRVRVARAGLDGLDIAAMMAAAVRDEAPPRPPAGRQAYRVEGLQVMRGGQAMGGMGRLLVEGETRADGFAGGRIALHEVAVERTEETAVVLDAVGLDRLSMELTIDASWTPTNERLEVSALAFGVRDLAALALGWTVEGMDITAANPDPATVRLLEARLRYADQSLYERMLADQARRQNSTPAQVRAEHRELVTGVLTGPRPDPALDAAREALLRFVAGQAREVEITARPPSPLSLAEAQGAMGQGPAAMMAQLGVRVVAR